jgi:hypothetical protein
MLITSILTAAAGGKAVVKPIMSHVGTGAFRILNFNPETTYQLSVTAGSISRSGDMVTLSNSNSIGKITAVSPRGFGICTRVERRAYTFTRTQVGTTPTFPCNCKDNKVAECNEAPFDVGSCPGNCPCYDADQNRCICWRWGQPTQICYSTCGGDPIFEDIKDPMPIADPPYVDQFGEYSRILEDCVV